MTFSVLSPKVMRWIRYCALIATVLLCVATMFALGREVVKKLDALKIANADSAQWTFAQTEVDYYRYVASLEAYMMGESDDVMDVRQNFDIFYSRVAMLSDSTAYKQLREDSDYNEPLGRIQAFLTRCAAKIDGSDEELVKSIETLHADADALAKDVRKVALRGLQLHIGQSDSQRNSVATTLWRLALLTAALVAVLSLVSILMFRMYRVTNTRENQIRETALRMSSVLKSSLDAIVVIDQEGLIIEYNGAASEIFGYSVEEAMGAQMETLLVPPRYYNAHRAGMKRFIESRQKRVVGAGRIELEALHKDGRVFPVELSIDVAEHNGRLIFVSFMRDITEEKAAQKELVLARDRALAGEKAKAEFLAVMSHEMRTPLNGLLGSLSLMEDTKLSDRQKLFVEHMDASGRALLRHVNDVLDISKFEAGQVALEAELFNLNELLEEILANEDHIARQNNNTLKRNWVSKPLETVIGDKTKLRHILLNLVSNANKFTENGHVTIELKSDDTFSNTTQLEFRIVDTGVGIHPEDIDRIFHDFETLDSTYGRQNDGTGLGLGIVRRVVNLMGGQMGVDSVPGEGSTFWFKIKLGLPTEEHQSPWEQDVSATHAALDILMVEDNEINRFVLRGMLEAEGHTIDEAENGRLGVSMSERKKYDVILMDISMPVMDGMEATQHIRSGKGLSDKTPIVAVTAHAMPDELEEFRKVGITDCLRKPLDKKKLYSVIAKVTHKPTLELGTDSRGDHQMDNVSDIIDIERIDMMKEQLGEENLHNLLGRFVEEVRDVVGVLQGAEPGQTDVADLIPQIHKVAGSAAALGITGIHKQLNLLEIAGKGDVPDTMWDGLDNLFVVWAQSKDVITSKFNIPT